MGPGSLRCSGPPAYTGKGAVAALPAPASVPTQPFYLDELRHGPDLRTDAHGSYEPDAVEPAVELVPHPRVRRQHPYALRGDPPTLPYPELKFSFPLSFWKHIYGFFCYQSKWCGVVVRELAGGGGDVPRVMQYTCGMKMHAGERMTTRAWCFWGWGGQRRNCSDGEDKRVFAVLSPQKIQKNKKKQQNLAFHHRGEEGEAEQAVRDGSTEGGLGAGLVNPLVVNGDIGKGVDSLLLHRDPPTRSELGADHCFPRINRVNHQRLVVIR